MKQLALFAAIFCSFFSVQTVNAQTQFWSDNFEDVGAPSSGTRTPSLTFAETTVPYTRYFMRTDLASIAFQNTPYASIEGSKIWAGEDIDNRGGVNNVVSANQNITWTGINISGKSGLSFRGLVAANNIGGSVWEGTSFTTAQDYLKVEYSIDGGAWVKGVAFYSDNVLNGVLKVDTDGDLIGDGTALSLTMAEFTFNIVGTGTTLSVRFDCFTNGTANEEWGIDNFRLFETASTPLSTSSTSQVNISCNGGCNGSATVVATGGTSPYSYSWSPSGGTGATASGLCAGTYTVTINDNASGSITRTFTLTQPPSINLSAGGQTNISCNGGSNGTATVSPSGGTPSYTYSWAPSGGTAATTTGRAAGSYTVTVTDANTCQATRTFTLTQPTAINVSGGSQTNISCNGGSNGTATVSPSGGTPSYIYSWAPSGGTNATASGRPAGSYTVTVTDANSCQATRTFTLTQPPALGGSSIVTNIACFGGNTGAIDFTPSGGTPGYTYNWLPSGPTTQDRSGLTAGTYSVQTTDANGCTGTTTMTVTQPAAAVSGTSVVTNIACFGGNTGAINLTPTGGTGPYTYNWLPSGPTTEDRTGLTAGTYSVQTTDVNGCTGTVTMTVTQPAAPVSGSGTVFNVSCFGGSNGAINYTPSGGTGPYTYNWLPSGPTTEDRTGLVAGTYTVQTTDVNGCTGTNTFTLTQPTAPVSGTTVVTNVACNGGSNGAINLTPTGGTPGYTYNWLPSGPTTEDRTGLTAGTYTVQITDANGCTGTVNATLTQPTAAVSGSTVVTNVACNGGSNGAINLTPTGGTPGYTYNWLPSGPTTEDRTGLTTGTYTVQITDANGCTGTVNVTVTQPTAIAVTPASQTNVACFGGSNGAASINTPTGGAGGYTYNWTPGNPTGDGTISVTGLTAGTWTVTTTDANSCTATQSFTVTQPPAISVTPASQTNVSCFGGSNGAASINAATGGAGGYTYNWTPGNPTGDGTVSVTGLTAGTRTVTVTDANSCTATQVFTLTQPMAISVTPASQTNVSCFGGSNGAASINTPTGGAGGYTYNWTPGNPTGDGTTSVTGLAATTWAVNVTDANGCVATQNFTVTQPTALSVTPASQTNISCFGGSNGAASINTPTGGAGGYTYNWTPGTPTGDGTTSVTGLVATTWAVNVTDANGCVATQNFTVTQPTALSVTPASQTNISCFGGSNGAASINTPTGGAGGYTYNWTPGTPTGDGTTSVTGLAATTWAVNVTDANGCVATQNFTVTQPTALSVTPASQTNISCFGGSNGAASINTPTGGAGGYTYNWTPGNPTGDGTTSVTGLVATTWAVNVTDANGCVATQNFTVTQPTAITVTPASQTNISCFGGSNGAASINTPTGGAGGYTYNWTPGTPTGDGTTSVTGLTAGTWTATVMDANGCTRTQNFTVTQPTALSATTSQTDATCGATDGVATVNVSGGTPGYTYSWAPSGGIAASATGLAAGSYTVTIQDANTCSATRTFTIIELINFTATVTPTAVSCNGGADGEATVSITGGTGPFTYSWAPSGGTAATASGLTTGTYTVTITDGPGTCSTTRTVSVTQPTAITGSVLTTSASCNGGANGSINLIPFGGTGPYTFVWSNGAITEDISGLTAGTYTVTVTDDNGCEGILSGVVGQPTAIISSISITTSLCSGGNDGALDLSVTGGTPGYTYVWSNTEPTQDIADLVDGTYYVTITDANGCFLIDTADIASPIAVTATTTKNNVSCYGANNGSAIITATGGVTPYTYGWSTGATTSMITSRAPGVYTYTVTDDNGCTFIDSVTITQPDSIAITTMGTSNVSCFGGANGSIDATVTGGVTPYIFNWSNSTHNEDLTGASSGVYTLTVVDGSGCAKVKNAGTITQPVSAVNVLIDSVFNVSCNGNANGRIYTTAAGGTGTITYLWSNAITTDDVAGLTPNTYSLTVTDANSCNASVSATISQPAVLDFDTVVNNVNCFGDNTGFVDVNVTGGVLPYTYLWSNGSNTEDLLNIGAGTYTLTLTDANGCVLNTGPIVITESPELVGDFDSLINVKCYGQSTGSIYLTLGGASPPLSYSWSNGTSTEDLLNVPAGNYILTITDALGCTLITPILTITQPAAPLSVSVDSAFNVTCNGAANGEIQSTANGGTPPYIYLWSNGATSADVTGLVPGSYSLVVTDINGCSASMAAVTITEPAVLVLTNTTQLVSCNGGNTGSIDLTVAGGVTPYTYLWTTTETTQDISDLTAGVYTVTVTDANLCIATATITVGEPAVLTATAVAADALCNAANGSVNLTVSGGVTPYGYSWSNNTGLEDLAAVPAGAYTVTVNDFNGCVTTASVTVSQPSAFSTGTVVVNTSCNGFADGEIDLTVSGGTGAYSYLWSNSAITEDITGLTAGSYTVTVTDDNFCTVVVSAVVGQPAVLSAQASVTNVSCNAGADGEIDITVAGGTFPYTFLWSNIAITEDVTGLTAGTYSVTVQDVNSCTVATSATVTEPAILALSAVTSDVSCNSLADGAINLSVTGGTQPYNYIWSNSAITDDVSGLTTGIYQVSVTDDNGCSASLTATVNEPAVLIATATPADALCNGGATGGVDVTVTGGTQPYIFAWSNSAATEDLTALVAGTYTLTVTDANSCSTSVSATVGQPNVLSATAIVDDATCNGAANGEADITVSGGTMPYIYLWSNGTTNEDATGLAAGVHTYTVTDGNGCTYVGSVTVTAPAAIGVAEAISSVTCNGDADGSIDLDVTGGTGPYTFQWSGTAATTEDLSNLSGGTFNVTVTDANSCTASFGPYVVNEPAALAAVLDSFNNVACFGESTGDVYLTIAGGTTPYTYLWSNGSNSQDLVNVPVGVYTGTVTDAHGCTLSSPPIPITGPAAALTVVLDSVHNVTCNGAADGAVYITSAGGTGPYTYLWSSNAATDDVTGLGAGAYDVTVTDANGCSAVLTGNAITEPALLTATSTATDVVCEGDVTGTVDVIATGGTGPYTPVWSSVTTTNLAAGTYTVTVTDANACVVTATATINFTNALPVVNLGADTTQCGGTVTLNAGNAGAIFVWSDGSATQTLTTDTSGIYIVVVTSATCAASDTVSVTINAVPQIAFNITADTLCLNDAAITLSASPAGGAFSGGIVSNGILTPDAAGIYPITYAYTDANNCSASVTDTVVVEVCVGIEEVAVATKLSVYPIPNSGTFTIEASAALTCELTNNLGQLIQVIELNADNNYKYEVANLATGMYYVIASNGSAKSSHKVLVVD